MKFNLLTPVACIRKARIPLLLSMLIMTSPRADAQTLTPEFEAAGYTLTDLGSIENLPAQYGGLTIRPSQPNTLYIGGSANVSSGALYTVPLLRDPVTNQVTGFGGPATLLVSAPNNDGGVFYAPNGTLLFTRYNMNEIGQILPDNTYVSSPLTPLGVLSSVGSIALVPGGYPGAGNLIVVSYNAAVVYHLPYAIEASGLYTFSAPTAEVSISETAAGPEGIAYIPAGSLAFPNLSMAISSYGLGKVMVYEVGEHGLPVPATAREMVVGLTGAEGALIDPLTGDFLFSTFGGGNKVVRISGFEKPNSANSGNSLEQAGFRLFPNPGNGIFYLEPLSNAKPETLEVFNLRGEKLIHSDLSEVSPTEIDLTGQPAGIYLVKVAGNSGTGFKRIVKK